MPPHASLFERDDPEIAIKQVPQEPGVPIMMAVLLFLACTAVSLRFYTRFQLRNLSWDDYAMLCALVRIARRSQARTSIDARQILYAAYSATVEKISLTVAGQHELPLDVMATSLQVRLSDHCRRD